MKTVHSSTLLLSLAAIGWLVPTNHLTRRLVQSATHDSPDVCCLGMEGESRLTQEADVPMRAVKL